MAANLRPSGRSASSAKLGNPSMLNPKSSYLSCSLTFYEGRGGRTTPRPSTRLHIRVTPTVARFLGDPARNSRARSEAVGTAAPRPTNGSDTESERPRTFPGGPFLAWIPKHVQLDDAHDFDVAR